MAENCYQLAAEYVVDNPGWTLVHGYPTLTVPPYAKYGHAWAEMGPLVYDPLADRLLPKSIYYSVGKIDAKECQRYSRPETRDMLTEFENWGPWEEVPEGAMFRG